MISHQHITKIIAVIMAVAYYGYFTQPLNDYRPNPVGTRLI